MEMVIEMAVFSCENSATDICSDKNMSGLEYANDVMPLSKDPSR